MVADRHPLVLCGIRDLLENHFDLTIVGEATSHARAMRLLTELEPDIAIIDLEIAGLKNNVNYKCNISTSSTRVIILSGQQEAQYVQLAISAGVRGYVLKSSPAETFLQAIRAAQSGGLYLDPAVVGALLQREGPVVLSTLGGGAAPAKLSSRETDVIRMVAFGFTNKEVAGKLDITIKSVETYKTRAVDKLDLRSRARIVQYGLAQGWFNSYT